MHLIRDAMQEVYWSMRCGIHADSLQVVCYGYGTVVVTRYIIRSLGYNEQWLVIWVSLFLYFS